MTTTDATERKYALVKIAAGDYLLPDNDGQRVWRLRRYLDRLNDGPDRHYWEVYKWRGTVASIESLDPNDWDQWESGAAFIPTRRDAIDEALSMTRSA